MLKQYHAKQILNIALAGHSSSGKTTVAEAMLFLSGGLERLGRVSEGTATLILTRRKSKEKHPSPRQLHLWNGRITKLILIDTPGLFDFEGSVCEAVRAADTMLIAVSAKKAVLVLVRKRQWQQRIKMIWQKSFVNGLCDESADFTKYSKI